MICVHRSQLFTVDPADLVAPIHDEVTDTFFAYADATSVSKSTATCRAMQSTTIGVEMEGCSGDGFYTPLTLYSNYSDYPTCSDVAREAGLSPVTLWNG
jgi:hypothetical protein